MDRALPRRAATQDCWLPAPRSCPRRLPSLAANPRLRYLPTAGSKPTAHSGRLIREAVASISPTEAPHRNATCTSNHGQHPGRTGHSQTRLKEGNHWTRELPLGTGHRGADPDCSPCPVHGEIVEASSCRGACLGPCGASCCLAMCPPTCLAQNTLTGPAELLTPGWVPSGLLVEPQTRSPE